MPRGESLYAKFPEYRVDLEPNPERVSISVGEATLAKSERSLLVVETKHDPVLYIPRDDVTMELLERTSHETFCPFKGEATYYTIRAAGSVLENAVWSYEDPFEQVIGLKGYLSFYTDRVVLRRTRAPERGSEGSNQPLQGRHGKPVRVPAGTELAHPVPVALGAATQTPKAV